jgi:tetratricopeptide (TPR) repeat protein
MWSPVAAVEHANRALAIDSTFGLARAVRAWHVGGPTRAAEMTRALSDASRVGSGSATVVLGLMFSANIPLRAAASMMFPNDPGLAFDRAIVIPLPARLDSLRSVTRRFPSYVPAKMWLAFNLVPNVLTEIPRATGDEALRVAQEALLLAPNSVGAHTVVGHVLERILRHDEAMTHLNHARAIRPGNAATYRLIAEIAIRDGNSATARAALDTAARLATNLSSKIDNARIRDMQFLAAGDLRAAMDGLSGSAREAEVAGLALDAGECHIWMAHVAAADRNAALAQQHLAEAARLGVTPLNVATQQVYAYAIAGDGALTRRAFEEWTRLSAASAAMPAIAATLTLFSGLTLLAEGKAAEAIPILQSANPNNRYQALGLIEAYKLAGRTTEAAAERAALLARKDVPVASTVLPILRYRIVANK